ncbi:MAG: putative phage abortive infection protein [Cyclobacteriaceae bacterium]
MKTKTNKTEDKSPDLIKIGGVAASIVIILWILNWVLASCFLPIDEAGQFGDRFGASTSLFGGITIIGLLITIFLQRQEIHDGKKEFKQQNRTLKYQRFDNTFFNMITLHNQIIENLSAKRQSFSNFIKTYINEKEFTTLTTLKDLQQEYKRTPMGGVSMNTMVEDNFGQYINNFEMIIDIILTSKSNPKVQDKYLKIYFAQLTNLERILLLYHFNLSDRKTKENTKKWDKFKYLLFRPLIGSNQIQTYHTTKLDGVPI